MNQFFYSRTEKDNEGKELTRIDSLNVEMVIRSYETDGGLIVLLDDGHEDSTYVEVPKNGGKGVEIKKERRFLQSEIVLQGEDINKFRSQMGYAV
jgi:hypothetical protein